MKQLEYIGARHYALRRLQELPVSLTYHSVRHTRDDVVPALEALATGQSLDDHSLLLLRTAAWYHDIGFVEQPIDHEAIGVRIAAQILPRFGYSVPDIAAIGGMIMATKLPQSPHTVLEQLLADADLDSLGRSDFLERNRDLRDELNAQGLALSDREWYSEQLEFLRSHRYWTDTARSLRDVKKQRNVETLVDLLAACNSSLD